MLLVPHRLESLYEVQLHPDTASTLLPMSFGQGVGLLDAITESLPEVG
jgi:hypothetical protein